MRILLVAQFFWPKLGGAEVVLRELAREWVRQNHAVTVLTTRLSPHLPSRETEMGVVIERRPFGEHRFIGTPLYLARTMFWIRTQLPRFDAVCVSMLKYAALSACTMRTTNGAPLVLRTEGAGSTGDVAWQRRGLGSVVRRACMRADRVVAISPEIERELLDAGYPRDRVVNIPNGVQIPDSVWSPGNTSPERRRLGLPDVPTLCYTGRLRPEKGLHAIVSALPKVRAAFGPCQILLVGAGTESESLAREAAALGVSEAVHFPGRVDDVTPWLRAADVFVLPSHVEGLSISLLEALAIGIPAVASDIEANRALVPEALLPCFPPGNSDALAETVVARLRSPESERIASEARRLVVGRFGLPGVASRYVDLFGEISRDRANRVMG